VELEKSVKLDPEYVEARINLGAQYTRLGRFQEAETQFRKAVLLDPNLGMAQSNLAIALAKQGRLVDAEKRARNALRIEPSNATGEYVLACVLAVNPSTRAEAHVHMRIAARTLPLA